jgi:translation initiation factor 1 (eIF-1/SUI1)
MNKGKYDSESDSDSDSTTSSSSSSSSSSVSSSESEGEYDVFSELNNKVMIHVVADGNRFKTNIIGLSFFLKKAKITSPDFIKIFKKRLGCGCTILKDAKNGEVLSFQGDQSKHLIEYINTNKIARMDQITLKGV